MDEQDIEYYRQRAATELGMASEADRSDVAAIHQELAEQYQALVEQSELRKALKAATPLRLWSK